MKLVTCLCLVLISMVMIPDRVAAGPGLDGPLAFLEPLVGKEWTGGYTDAESAGIVIDLHFKAKLGGATVQYSRDVKSLDYHAVTNFYYDPQSLEVRFVSADVKRTISIGTVTSEDGKIIILGESRFEGGSYEFKTVLEVYEEGKLRDLFYRKSGDDWVQRHHQEFTAKEE